MIGISEELLGTGMVAEVTEEGVQDKSGGGVASQWQPVNVINTAGAKSRQRRDGAELSLADSRVTPGISFTQFQQDLPAFSTFFHQTIS